MKWLSWFKKKSQPTVTTSIKKIGGCVSINGLDIFGPYSESENGEYLLVRRDADEKSGRGGYRTSGNGRFTLLKDSQIIYHGECERPTEGAVSNSGTFIIADSLFGDSLKSKLYVFAPSGELLMSHLFSAKIFSVFLSPDGEHGMAQLANSSSSDASKLYIFDIESGRPVASFIPESGWADEYEVGTDEGTVWLINKDGGRYKYSFDGVLLNPEQYAADRREKATALELVFMVRTSLPHTPVSQLPLLLSMINKALMDEQAELRGYLALALKLKGNILEAMNEIEQAISAYQRAIDIDPKIGVKQRLSHLQKQVPKAENS